MYIDKTIDGISVVSKKERPDARLCSYQEKDDHIIDKTDVFFVLFFLTRLLFIFLKISIIDSFQSKI